MSSRLPSRGRAVYPSVPQALPTTQQQRNNGSGSSLFSRQTLIVLGTGIMFGYLLLPILLVQHLGFDDTAPTGMARFHQAPRMPRGDKGRLAKDARRLTTAEPQKKVDVVATEDNEENTPPDTPPEEEEEDGATERDGDKAEDAKSSGNDSGGNGSNGDSSGGNGNTSKIQTHPAQLEAVSQDAVDAIKGLTEVEKRLMSDRAILGQQSMPTSTTPYIMKTTTLPDHHRKKILVTGGAGFVGSHLVDKLMMEGHEVIVADNFFTGQKKNIAHWLHHPNFR